MYVIIPTTLVCVATVWHCHPYFTLQFFCNFFYTCYGSFFGAFAIVFILIAVLIFSFAFSIIVYDIVMLIGIKDGHTT